jgi:uncharacterized protein (DUF1330 family)
MSTKPAYLLAYVKVNSAEAKDRFVTDYAKKVPPTLAPFGGSYFMKALPISSAALVEEGLAKAMTLAVVLRFPSAEKALGWKKSEAYQAILPVRLETSTGPLVIVEGLGNEDKVEGGVGAVLMAFVKVSDMENFKQYAGSVPKTLEPFSGQYLAKALPISAAAKFAERTTAEDFTLAVMLGFPSVEKALAWKKSDAYQAILPTRKKSSQSALVIAATIGGASTA